MGQQYPVYTVLPDFELGGKNGPDSLDWTESDDQEVNLQQARLDTIIGNPGPLQGPWNPLPVTYIMKGLHPVVASFYEFGSFIAASSSVKEKLAGISDFEWLPLACVHNSPLQVSTGSPSYYVMRFARTVTPHPSSEFTLFPGTKSIDEVLSLVLSGKDADDLYAFRLEGDPVTHYATQKLVDICEREGLKGLEFTPIECELK